MTGEAGVNRHGPRRATRSRAEARPERLRLGFLPLVDCAPLVVAQRVGLFREEGLDVVLRREASWANVRDRLQLGMLDAAQMLAPMPLAASLGLDGAVTPIQTALVLNLNGNAITVSEPLYQALRNIDAAAARERPASAALLAHEVVRRRNAGEPKLRFASVYPFSTHNYQLRYWLAAAGIDPDRDLSLQVVPPPLMADHLEAGWIDGYCVGEPWNTVAVEGGLGRPLITSQELWNNGAEKVLGVRSDWAGANPIAYQALLRALLRAGQWLERPENRIAAAAMLADDELLAQPRHVILAALTGLLPEDNLGAVREVPDMLVFHRYAAGFPWRSQAMWYGLQMARWGQLPPGIDLARAVTASVRPDLCRQAATALGLSMPLDDLKTEGHHDRPRLVAGTLGDVELGPDRFFDAAIFDPGSQRMTDMIGSGGQAADS